MTPHRFIRLALFLFLPISAGCAHAPSSSSASSAAALNAAPATPTRVTGPSESAPKLTRVPLPYQWQRSGVDLRATAIEFSGSGASSQVLVNLSVKEGRGRPVTLTCDRLLEARSDNHMLKFAGCRRASAKDLAPEFSLKAGEADDVVIAFEHPSESGDMELRFPTGKWWASK